MLAQTLFEGSRGHVRAAGFQFGQVVDAVAEEGDGVGIFFEMQVDGRFVYLQFYV